MKKKITQNERYVLSVLLFWLVLHFIFFGLGEFEANSWRSRYWWPFDDGGARKMLGVYDITEFIFYGVIPLLVFVIYYVVLKKPEREDN